MNKKSSPLVLVSHALPDGWLQLLEERCELIIGPPEGDQLVETLTAKLPFAEGLFTLLTIKVDEDLLDKAPNLSKR